VSESHSPGILITPSLVIARLATWPIGSITGLLLIDIGQTFNQSVAIMGQIRTIGSLVGVVFALLLGALSVKYNHKTLLVTGLLLVAVSALGCWVSPSFLFISLAYPLSEIGTYMVRPMSFSLVGALLPREKRSSAISWMLTGMAIVGILGGFVINYLNGIGGWRTTFLGFALPIALAAALIVHLLIPLPKIDPISSSTNAGLFSGFRQVFSNRSATACLIGQTISMATWGGILTYTSSFWRQVFGTSIGTVVLIQVGSGLAYIAGNLFTGKFANKYGSKRLSVVALLIGGITLALWIYLKVFWMAVVIGWVIIIFGGIRATAINSLTLEQIPSARGTLMSLNGAAQSLGTAIGAAVGGYFLISHGYTGLFLAYSVLFILGGLVISLLADEGA
jgi:predicted MFS family arabinose efflux permease